MRGQSVTEDGGSWSVSARAHATRFSGMKRGICLLDVVMGNSWDVGIFCFALFCFRHASLFVDS